MNELIKTQDLQRNVTAYLENAYGIGYEKVSNQIWSASFSLPLNDPKVKSVELLKYVEITDEEEYIGLFRIIPKKTLKNESTQEVNFQCEHVLATLLNSNLFKYHQLTNYYTKEVLQYLLDRQREKHWKLGTVEISRRFSYSWENENLLSAIFSVPNPFDEQYRWTWDTTSYPWTLNLVRPDMEPTCRIKERHNLLGFELEENPMSMVNRIYPLGYGEGVNQLTIEKVNNKIPYIEDAQSIAENGVFETVWVDRTIKNPSTLKANGQALLKKWKEPIVTWTTSAADVSRITKTSIDELKEGKVVRLQIDGFPETDLRIMKETKPDIKAQPWDVQLEIGNVIEDLSTTQSDLERRQQVNELVAQGATNIITIPLQDNADSANPMIMPFVIDDDVVNVNTLELWLRVKKFRAYEKPATGGGGAIVESTESGGGTTRSTSSGGGSTQTSSSGGGSTQTSSAGGGTSKSTESGGGSAQTSSAGGDHTHLMFTVGDFLGPVQPYRYKGADNGQLVELNSSGADLHTAGGSGDHTHSINIPAHTHSFTIPNHTHDITIPNHTHTVTIPAHTHDVDIPPHTHEIKLPNHTHEIIYGIFLLDELPTNVQIRVDGNLVPFEGTSADRLNLIDYIEKDETGRIVRGRHEVELLPNERARIEADLILRLFINSHIGGDY